jgi:hypothetical protein
MSGKVPRISRRTCRPLWRWAGRAVDLRALRTSRHFRTGPQWFVRSAVQTQPLRLLQTIFASQRRSLRLILRARKSCSLVRCRLVLSSGRLRSGRQDLSHAANGLDLGVDWRYNLSLLEHAQAGQALEVRRIVRRSTARVGGCWPSVVSADLENCKYTSMLAGSAHTTHLCLR